MEHSCGVVEHDSPSISNHMMKNSIIYFSFISSLEGNFTVCKIPAKPKLLVSHNLLKRNIFGTTLSYVVIKSIIWCSQLCKIIACLHLIRSVCAKLLPD